MDDLVARLRVARDMWLREREFIYNVHNSLYGQAADAIEQLTAERDALQAKLAESQLNLKAERLLSKHYSKVFHKLKRAGGVRA